MVLQGRTLGHVVIHSIVYLVLSLQVTTDVQSPQVRYVGANFNLTCEFADGSTAEACFFNFTGIKTEAQTFFVNRSENSSVATTCAMSDAAADDKNYMWSAFDDIGGVPITVELIPVDSRDEDNFTCQPGMQRMWVE